MAAQISTNALDVLTGRLSPNTPVTMLNLLRFHADGGREVYFGTYVPAFQAVVADQGIVGIMPVWIGDVAGAVAAPATEVWDVVAIIRYPSFAAFRSVVESSAYRERAEPHRLAAVADWRLIAQTELVLA